ncbi:MAG TPA: NifB/NifX family molybdenum-iron cluster-binding protein [Bacteroidales bacterium]|nr:NifB/NifX family molybdenum-iron cluster-binding protein [Bacteroidales bacterium]
MKIAISAQDREISSPVACHFGRCCFFHIYDEETGTTEVLENCDQKKKECAGEAILQCLIGKNVRHIVSADFGVRVRKEMADQDIRMTLLTDCSKTVGDILRIIQHKQVQKHPLS